VARKRWAPTQWVHPRDIALLTVIACAWLAHWCPWAGLKEWLIRGFALVDHYLYRRKRHGSELNLATAFAGQLTEDQRRRIAKAAVYAFWEEPLSVLPSAREEGMLSSMSVQGIEHLCRALDRGKGAILWESSLGLRSLAKQALHQRGFSLSQVHAEHHIGGFIGSYEPISWLRSRLIEPFFENSERHCAAEFIYLPQSGQLAFSRTLLSRLKQNAIVCISGDAPEGYGLIPMPFLGQIELFATGMVSLARMCGAAILPVFCVRAHSGRADLVIEPRIPIQQHGDRDSSLRASMASYVRLLESYIRRYPEQYRRWHYVGDAYREREAAA
jgi:lauroyl/myristoyl acyltransferase